MPKEYMPPATKSTPVSSPLQNTVHSLRFPQRPPPLANGPSSPSSAPHHQRKPSRNLSDELGKKRLVDQFYDAASLSGTAPRPAPLHSRTNTQESIKREDPLDFLRPVTTTGGHALTDKKPTVVLQNVRNVEKRVFAGVKHELDYSARALDEDTAAFNELQSELDETRYKVQKYLSLITANQELVDKDYGEFKKEIERLYTTLDVLGQNETAIQGARTKLLENKEKLKGLWEVVEHTEKQQVIQKESIKSRNKTIIYSFLALVILLGFYMY